MKISKSLLRGSRYRAYFPLARSGVTRSLQLLGNDIRERVLIKISRSVFHRRREWVVAQTARGRYEIAIRWLAFGNGTLAEANTSGRGIRNGSGVGDITESTTLSISRCR